MTGYFEKFPLVEYEGRTCVDITRRVTLRRTITSDPRAYRPYDVPAGTRAEQVADGYYDNVEKEWLVLMSASILDPYYDWYLSDRDFAAHLIERYGSLEETIERVHHWQVNWYASDEELTPSEYDTLPDQLKRYYEPRFSVGSTVMSYVRRDIDAIATTNAIVTVELGPDHGVASGDRVQVLDGASLEGQAEIAWANSTHAKLVHVQAPTDPGLTVLSTTGRSGVIVSREYTSNVIPVEERAFWEPVSVFEWERDKNESSKSIRLVDARFAQAIESELDRILST